jgi:hypothetical protein
VTHPDDDAPAAPRFLEVLEDEDGDAPPGLCVPFR